MYLVHYRRAEYSGQHRRHCRYVNSRVDHRVAVKKVFLYVHNGPLHCVGCCFSAARFSDLPKLFKVGVNWKISVYAVDSGKLAERVAALARPRGI